MQEIPNVSEKKKNIAEIIGTGSPREGLPYKRHGVVVGNFIKIL